MSTDVETKRESEDWPSLMVDREHRGAIGFPEYLSMEGISSSAIRKFAIEGPLHYHWRHILGHQPEQTNAMRLGTMFHAYMEDQKHWLDRYAVRPGTFQSGDLFDSIAESWGPKASKALKPTLKVGEPLNNKFPAHREYIERWDEAASKDGMAIVERESEIEDMACMMRSVLDNPCCAELIEKIEAQEQCYTASHKKTGLLCKAMLDIETSAAVIEIKATEEATPMRFYYRSRRMLYHHQVGFHGWVAEKSKGGILMVRSKPPWESNLFSIPERLIEEEWSYSDYWLQQIRGAMDMTFWHSEGWGEVLPYDEEQLREQTDVKTRSRSYA